MDGLMNAITAFGVVALTLMMVTYALERRHRAFTWPLRSPACYRACMALWLGPGHSESLRSFGAG